MCTCISTCCQNTPTQKLSSLTGLLSGEDEGLSPQSRSGELTRSITSSVSAVSTRSDVTLVHEDDNETVVDEGERGRAFSTTDSVDSSEQRGRQNTLTENDAGNGRADGGEECGVGTEGGGDRTEGGGTDTEVGGAGIEGGGAEAKRGGAGTERGGGESEEVIDVHNGVNGEDEERKEGEGEEVATRHMSVVFRQELLNTVHLKIDSRIGLEIAKLSDSHCDIVQLVGRCLPHIVPNVILAKREVRLQIYSVC